MYQFNVEGMTCDHCAASIIRSVQSVDPKAAVAVDIPSKQVRVETARSLADIEAAIVEAGYTVNSRHD
ncbi:heavy-metal-associated domain-containing protein [Paraburkholderia fungorum]|uniref:Copper chaperone n=1 Tax=Paraburkholderia fungorum TaxID=134537 RepID=A0AAW3UZL7_9BURK|nr:heavy-metal-associated domain-containing protein [Paraburkholderia fungorum]MBB4518622.1 copper chaperone [Paraburkholderia fungorum]MBB6204107.1 copper chaperone [Paraburkholderia fungorum]